MKAVVVSKRRDCFLEFKEGVEIAVLAVNLFDMIVFAVGKPAIDALHNLADKWEKAVLGPISEFHFPWVPKNELVSLLQARIPDLEIVDKNGSQKTP